MFGVFTLRKPWSRLRELMPSGQMEVFSRSISKRGSPSLRRTLFLVMGAYLQQSPQDEPVYQFMNKKRSEGKSYRVYMMASSNKFLHIYYATVKAYLNSLKQDYPHSEYWSDRRFKKEM